MPSISGMISTATNEISTQVTNVASSAVGKVSSALSGSIPGVGGIATQLCSTLTSGFAGATNAAANAVKGFLDPSGVYPTEYREGQSDWHRFTGRKPDKISAAEAKSQASIPLQPQSEYNETHCETRESARAGVIVPIIPASKIPWKEPESDKNTIYGQAWVLASHGGVTMEIDSTMGSQAWRVTHPSNSFMEINGAGTFIQKTFGERYDIIAMGHKTFVNSSRNTVIQSKDELRVVGNTLYEHDAPKTEICLSTSSLTVTLARTETCLAERTVIVGGTNMEKMAAASLLTVGGVYSVTVGGPYLITSKSMVSIIVKKSFSVLAKGAISLVGKTIMLN